MADQLLELSLVTPGRELVADKVDQVNIPASEGDIGILYDHAPIITTLRPGPLSYQKGNETVELVVSGGYAEVTDNRVTILAETAEFAHEVDRQRATVAREKAEKILARADLSEEEFKETQLKLFRAIARLEHTESK